MTDDDKTLVKRLRWSASGKVGAEQARLERNAADRIETLNAILKAAEESLGDQLAARKEQADRIEAQAAEIEHLKDVYSSATECFLEAQEKIEQLRKAGTKMSGYAGHDDNCEIMLKGVWSDPIPCTCGYENAWKAWAALGGAE